MARLAMAIDPAHISAWADNPRASDGSASEVALASVHKNPVRAPHPAHAIVATTAAHPTARTTHAARAGASRAVAGTTGMKQGRPMRIRMHPAKHVSFQ
jgi:hypothetical protein